MSGGLPPLLGDLVGRARTREPVRVAVVDAGQPLVMETLRDATALGLARPVPIGDPEAIERAGAQAGWSVPAGSMVAAGDDVEAAAVAVALVRAGEADVIMKGLVHTEELMHVLLDRERGLRSAGRRVSHLFLTEVPGQPRLLGITDAAVNIAPDLEAKAQILRNAIELFHVLGRDRPKAAVLSAIETVNPAVVSSLDAACLTLMARRGQIEGALVDGPLAFDNAVSAAAAREKGIESDVAGAADILLVPDLVSGNILAKNLEYLAGAVAAGIVLGLRVPVVLSSRADPPAARIAGLALASLVFHHERSLERPAPAPPAATVHCAPQPEHACCPIPTA